MSRTCALTHLVGGKKNKYTLSLTPFLESIISMVAGVICAPPRNVALVLGEFIQFPRQLYETTGTV